MILIDVRGTRGNQAHLDQSAGPEASLGATLNISICSRHLGCDTCGLGCRPLASSRLIDQGLQWTSTVRGDDVKGSVNRATAADLK